MRNVIRGRDSRLDQERAFGAVALVIVADPKRGAVGHIGDGVGFDNGFAIGVPPDLAGIASTSPSDIGAEGSWCTSSHCLTISLAFAGWTVRSALPCQTESFGHGPL